MPSTREVQARHEARIRRKTEGATGVFAVRRHFTPERTGPPCPVCHEPTSRYLLHKTGERRHPCCQGI